MKSYTNMRVCTTRTPIVAIIPPLGSWGVTLPATFPFIFDEAGICSFPTGDELLTAEAIMFSSWVALKL